MKTTGTSSFELQRSRFSVRVQVRRPAEAGRYVRRTSNRELRTVNSEPNLNPNLEVRTTKFERQDYVNA